MKTFDNNVIFPQHRLIYVAIPKVANSAVKRALLPLAGDAPAGNVNVHDRSGGPFEYCTTPDVLDYPDFFKVALVRNPWSRVYSCWYEKVFTRLHEPLKYGFPTLRQGMPFDEFVRAISEIPDERSNVHFRAQSALLMHKGRLVVDLALPMERITLFLQIIQDYTKVPLAPLKVVNQGSLEPYTAFYNKETIELVRRRYQHEIELFGFEFGASSGSPAETGARGPAQPARHRRARRKRLYEVLRPALSSLRGLLNR